MTYSINEAQRLYEASAIKPELRKAQKLVHWLVEKDLKEISLRDIQLHGSS